ncbi:MAG: carboxypeptidase regulatory-like domain-containing protein [Terriglobia bacterium]
MSSKYSRRASRFELPIVLMGALLVALFTCFVQPMAAQESRGKIRGVVTDPTHAVVPGAKVTLRNTGTGVETVHDADSSGFYIFDPVIPGTYSVAVEAAGFEKFVQQNVSVQVMGDVTVNAILTLGAVTQTVEVTAAVASVEFNTSNMTTTVQQSYLKDLPVLARNPFSLALLDAGVINDYWDMAHRLPFYMWSDGGLDIGGPTGGKNEQILDGTRTDIAARGTYNAPMDAVQEVVVQQNIPDAEHGFSAGGAVNISMKSGTNSPHGSAYYMGRQTALNALANRVTRSPNIVKQTIYGGTLGNSIIKDKLFNFVVYEHWYATQPSTIYDTMPTAAEKAGDFSGAEQNDGTLRPIYDPTTSVFNPVTGDVTRQQFLGNKIPANRIDPTAALLMPYIWGGNTTPQNLDGLNNLQVTFPWWTRYWNFSDRVDYNVNDKWRMFAHFSKFNTRLDNVNWSDNNSAAVPSQNGGIMDAESSGMDVLYMANPRTTLDIRLGVNYEEDDYNSTIYKLHPGQACTPGNVTQFCDVWQYLWPSNNWYQPLTAPTIAAGEGYYFPDFTWSGIGGANTGFGGWWYDHLRDYSPTIILTHEMGKHHVKFGWQYRYAYSQNFESTGPGYWYFNSVDTASTILSSYNPSQSGDVWASSLIGAMSCGTGCSGANATIYPTVDQIHYHMYGFFVQDDFRLNPRTTLNLGLRWERETSPADINHYLIKTLDMQNAIPGFQTAVPTIWTPGVQAAVTAAGGGGLYPTLSTLVVPNFTGAAIRSSANSPGTYQSPWDEFLPRAGLAFRLNDKTAIRVGYSRFAVSQVSNRSDESSNASNGYFQATSGLAPLEGVPREYLNSPFPTGGTYPNPIIPALGNSLGRYQDLGNSWGGYYNPNQFKIPMNDRFNFNVQRQLPAQFRLDATMFMMFEHNAQDGSMWGGFYSRNVNMMNPEFSYKYQGLLGTNVPNPFYNVFPTGPSTAPAGYSGIYMPGYLGTSATIPLSQLLTPYPQYGSLNQWMWPGYHDHYYGLALSVTRPLTHGWTFLGTYNYSLQSHSNYYNDIATFNNDLTMFDRQLPRHNLRLSGTYQLPFGSGRQYLAHVNKVVDEIINGWSTSDIFFWMGGDLMSFPTTGVVCNPTQNIPTGYWINPNCLVNAPAYTIATAPPYYEGMRGPRYWELDSTFVKEFKITERYRLEFRMELYNLTNHFIPADPNICGVTQSCGATAGLSTAEASGSNGANYGREIQYSARFHF